MAQNLRADALEVSYFFSPQTVNSDVQDAVSETAHEMRNQGVKVGSIQTNKPRDSESKPVSTLKEFRRLPFVLDFTQLVSLSISFH